MSVTRKEAQNILQAHKTALKIAKLQSNDSFYSMRSLLGYSNKAIFYILLGGRDYGKSYAVMMKLIIDWKTKGIPFCWIRLNEASTAKLLKNNADKLVDPDIRRKFNLRLKTIGNDVYESPQDKERRMATVNAIATY